MIEFIVGKENCQFETINEALCAAHNCDGDGVVIKIMPGTYNEKVNICNNNVHLQGSGTDRTIITYGLYAKKIHEDGKNYGTFRTATVDVKADGFSAQGLTIINSSGNGKEYGQAIALSVDGDDVHVTDCRLIARQDTLFAGPHPSGNEIKRQFYKDCYIEGDIDFIFGGARAYFENCEIFSRYGVIEDDAKIPEPEVGGQIAGYITAACTHQGAEYGFVFDRCRLTGDCPKNTVFLGRPWRVYAKTVFINCDYGKHIRQEGWYDWGKAEAKKTAYYAEYIDTGFPKTRVDWSKEMTFEEAVRTIAAMKN